jgi:hypothetical protein
MAKAAQACQIPSTPTSKRIAKGIFVAVQRAPATRIASRETLTLRDDEPSEEDSVGASTSCAKPCIAKSRTAAVFTDERFFSRIHLLTRFEPPLTSELRLPGYSVFARVWVRNS